MTNDADRRFVLVQAGELLEQVRGEEEIPLDRRREILMALAPRVERALAHARTLVGEAMDRGE